MLTEAVTGPAEEAERDRVFAARTQIFPSMVYTEGCPDNCFTKLNRTPPRWAAWVRTRGRENMAAGQTATRQCEAYGRDGLKKCDDPNSGDDFPHHSLLCGARLKAMAELPFQKAANKL